MVETPECNPIKSIRNSKKSNNWGLEDLTSECFERQVYTVCIVLTILHASPKGVTGLLHYVLRPYQTLQMHHASFVLFLTKNPVTQCLVSILQTRTPRLTKVKHHKLAHLTSEHKSMLLPRDSHPGCTTISSWFLKTATTPPHCPEGFNRFHWQNFLFSTTFVQNIGKPHTSSVSLWLAGSDNYLPGAGWRAM